MSVAVYNNNKQLVGKQEYKVSTFGVNQKKPDFRYVFKNTHKTSVLVEKSSRICIYKVGVPCPLKFSSNLDEELLKKSISSKTFKYPDFPHVIVTPFR